MINDEEKRVEKEDDDIREERFIPFCLLVLLLAIYVLQHLPEPKPTSKSDSSEIIFFVGGPW